MRHFDETLKYYNAISCTREMQKRLLEENNDLHLQVPFTIFQNYSVLFAIYYDCVYLQNLKKLTVLTEGESLEALKITGDCRTFRRNFKHNISKFE